MGTVTCPPRYYTETPGLGLWVSTKLLENSYQGKMSSERDGNKQNLIVLEKEQRTMACQKYFKLDRFTVSYVHKTHMFINTYKYCCLKNPASALT
jgi:hypothetical protein